MTTGLLNLSGMDFDSCFQSGTGTQLFYIYTNSGQDVGQRYLPASAGTAYGTINYRNSSGTDIGNLLCKIGTNDPHAGSYLVDFKYYSLGDFSFSTITLSQSGGSSVITGTSEDSGIYLMSGDSSYIVVSCVIAGTTVTNYWGLYNLCSSKDGQYVTVSSVVLSS